MPKTRPGLISLAHRIENTKKQVNEGGSKESRTQDKGKERERSQGHATSSRYSHGSKRRDMQKSAVEEKSRDRIKTEKYLLHVECYNCGEKGHYANTCSKPRTESRKRQKQNPQATTRSLKLSQADYAPTMKGRAVLKYKGTREEREIQALIDSGANANLISQLLVKKLHSLWSIPSSHSYIDSFGWKRVQKANLHAVTVDDDLVRVMSWLSTYDI